MHDEWQQFHYRLQDESDYREDGMEDGIWQRKEERKYHHYPVVFVVEYLSFQAVGHSLPYLQIYK